MNDMGMQSILTGEIQGSIGRDHELHSDMISALEHRKYCESKKQPDEGIGQTDQCKLEEAYWQSFATIMAAHIAKKSYSDLSRATSDFRWY
jgi:hypothetical protein